MNTERRQILQMLADGTITADEAERLLTAVEGDRPGPEPRTGRGPKYMRVVVNSEEPGGQGRIDIRVPLQLLRAGVRLASLVPPKALEQANAELAKAGYPMDLRELKPKDVEELIDHLADLTVDVDQPDTQVRIFCE